MTLQYQTNKSLYSCLLLIILGAMFQFNSAMSLFFFSFYNSVFSHMLGTLKRFLRPLPLNNLHSQWAPMVYKNNKIWQGSFQSMPTSASPGSEGCFLWKPFIKTSMMALTVCILIVLIKCSKWLAQGFADWQMSQGWRFPCFQSLLCICLGLILFFITLCSSPDLLLQSTATVKYINKQTS